MSKSIYEQVVEKIGHDYFGNYRLLEAVYNGYDEKQFTEEEHSSLGKMLVACIQINFFKEELGLDISEVNIKRYVLEEKYRGQFFDLEGLKSLFESANNGNAEHMLILASAFNDGYFSPGLSRYAAKWCELAAEAGNVDAMVTIASFYRWGDGGVFIDIDKALYWFGKAAELGNEDAIAFMDEFGDGSSNMVLEMSATSVSDVLGVKWYKSEKMIEGFYSKADNGDSEAQYELGRQLMPGTEYGAFKRSTKESIKYYEMSAEQGMVDAMFNLANAYNEGWSDLKPNPEKEFYWRKRAADAGDIEAAFYVGEMYIEGRGTYENFEEGIRYLKMAVDNQGVSKSMQSYYEKVCRIEDIYQKNKDKIVPINSDIYPNFEGDDRKYLQEYVNRIMYDLICGLQNGNSEYVLSTYNHIITLIEFAVRQSKPVVDLLYQEHAEAELDLLVRRFLYHYLDFISDRDGFSEKISDCIGEDERLHRQKCHKVFFENLDNSIASVQKDFPEFMKDWITGLFND